MDKTPVHYAAEYDQIDTIKFLMDNGGDMVAKDKVWHFISAFSSLLLSHFVTQEDKTPAQYAQMNGHTNTVKFLKVFDRMWK